MSDPTYDEAIRRVGDVLGEAEDAGDPEPTAMTLSTIDRDGRVSARVVLLKGLDERGFVFYTNERSLKGRQLADCPVAALSFLWKRLQKQVRVEGRVERVSNAEADAYFASRVRGSQIGAWASRQSEVLSGRDELEARIRRFESAFADQDVPRPPHWSGYRVIPDRIEVWVGREHRLHDRWLYRQRADSRWTVEKLYP